MDARVTSRATIAGLGITELKQITDARGAVLHFLRNDAPGFLGFGECYCSEVVPGAVKAWTRHTRQTQNLAVPVGRVRLLVFDDREGSPTRGRTDVLELGRPDAYVRLQLPPGLWYGFASIASSPALLVNCTDVPHSPSEAEQRAWDDPAMPAFWSVE